MRNMGMYDSVIIKCPKCGIEHEFQSKSGECFLGVYTLEDCPDDVMANVNRHSPYDCDCGASIEVDIENRKAVVINEEKLLDDLKNKILEEYKNGNIVIATPEGLQGTKLSEFIKQPTDGMLYDLNRNEVVVLTFINDPKWVNDYAVCQIIRALKSRIEELERGSL